MRVLIVEDEKKIAKALREGLEASSGEEGFFLVNHEFFDCVVLDLMLPHRNGLEVLTTLRKRGLPTPVLILTAKDTVDDRVRGLDCGADDYLVKPFALPELLARIRALLRRGRPDQVLKLRHDDLEMDLVTRKVVRGGRLIELTVKEFEVLEYLLRDLGRDKNFRIGMAERRVLVISLVKLSPAAVPDPLAVAIFIATIVAMLVWRVSAFKSMAGGAVLGILRSQLPVTVLTRPF